MMSDANAAVVGGLAGGFVGGFLGLLGVWTEGFFSRRRQEAERQNQKLLAIFGAGQTLMNQLVAYQKSMISREQIAKESAKTCDELFRALLGSKLDRSEKIRILKAVNGKWEEPSSVEELRKIGNELLEQIDAEYAAAGRALLSELGVRAEDLVPTVITGNSKK
jgi:hypothetical protein